MMEDTIKEKIRDVINKDFLPNDDGGIEMYLDYRDELGEKTLYDIMASDNPKLAFDDLISEWEMDDRLQNYEPELYGKIESALSENELEFYEENRDSFVDWINENWYFYYDASHFNKEVEVNLMLDVGNSNYDFTCDNILNYYGRGEIDKNSSVLWLARQFKKVTALRASAKAQFREDGYYRERKREEDPFIESLIQELENLPSHMGTMTFLLHMRLFDYFELRDAMKSEEKENESYEYKERKGTGYILVSKDTMCGLFEPWSGAGSVLEVELPGDLKIPLRAIFGAEIETGKSQYGYSVDKVYDLCGDCWKGTVKKIYSKREE